MAGRRSPAVSPPRVDRGSSADGRAAAAHGLARVLSKRGLCSRAQAERWIRAGRVQLLGRRCLDPEHRTRVDEADIRIDGRAVTSARPLYLAVNKPRGLVCTRSDERGRATVYDCLDDPDLPWLAPVGRLDQASEGLLLFSNDSGWAARITDPESELVKTYHVRIDRVADAALLEALRAGVVDQGERLHARDVRMPRHGHRTSWLAFELTGGRNRQLRRMLAAHGVAVLRLVRVGIGTLALGSLAKGGWRALDDAERDALAPPSPG